MNGGLVSPSEESSNPLMSVDRLDVATLGIKASMMIHKKYALEGADAVAQEQMQCCGYTVALVVHLCPIDQPACCTCRLHQRAAHTTHHRRMCPSIYQKIVICQPGVLSAELLHYKQRANMALTSCSGRQQVYKARLPSLRTRLIRCLVAAAERLLCPGCLQKCAGLLVCAAVIGGWALTSQGRSGALQSPMTLHLVWHVRILQHAVVLQVHQDIGKMPLQCRTQMYIGVYHTVKVLKHQDQTSELQPK